jgi:hypothetical protein
MIHEYLLQQAILFPARLFSFGLLDGPQVVGYQETAGSRGHGPLTISRASTSVTRLIRRIVDLAGAHTRGALYSSRRAPCKKPTGRASPGTPGEGGCNAGFGLSRFATAFTNNPA